MPNLLIVDDDAVSRQILADLVKVHGHTVVTAADGQAALEALSGPRGRFQAVIADVRMPGIDGIELARRIVAKMPELPVALTSAEPDFNIYEEALSRGLRATVMLQKPFQSRSVLRVLDQLLGGAGAVSDGVGAAPARITAPPRPSDAIPIGKDDAPAWLTQPPQPIARLAPVRLWFVGARRRASGTIHLDLPGGAVRIGLREGQLVQPAGARSPAELARWLLELHEGAVHFQPCAASDLAQAPVSGATVPEALALALSGVPHVTIQHSWRAVMSARAFARSPRDSHPEAWGLDSLATLAHETAKGQRVEALVLELARRSPAFRTSGFRSLEVLAKLNLLTLLA